MTNREATLPSESKSEALTSDSSMPASTQPSPQARHHYATDYQTGQDNIRIMGMDIHNPVFVMSAALSVTFVVCALAFPEQADRWLNGAKRLAMTNFDWFFVLVANFSVLFCVAVAISPMGRIRLGGEHAKTEFGVLSWYSMLFAAGVGIGLLFYGAAEPLAYFTNWFCSPLGVEPLSPEAHRLAFSATIFHWSINAWSIYAVMGLALAFFAYNKGLPLTVRSAFYPILGDRIWGWPGHIIDLLAVIATLFGLATSLGLGAKQAASGLSYLFGVEASISTQVLLIGGITCMAIVSVVRGLDGGVKLLSNINIGLAILFMMFIVVAGPTVEILASYGTNTLNYALDIVRLSNPFGRTDTDWFHGWTIFYWGWWIAWSPFVGMFIARVSRGRTIREFLAAVILVPTAVSIIWFSSFGTVALQQFQNGIGELPNGISDVSLVLFQMLDSMPLAELSSLVAIVLLIVFFVTSMDSGSLVLDCITAGGKIEAPMPQRVFWAIMVGLTATVLLIGGGSQALASLQAGTIAAGLPFGVVLLVSCFSLWKGLLSEPRNSQ